MDNEEIKKDNINKFLRNFKKHLGQRSLTFIMSEKNTQTMSDMGFTKLDVETELLKLIYKDYMSGPEADHDPKKQGDVWKFGKNINKENIYIKIKLSPDNRPVCLSFHYPERELKYFFK